MKRQVKLNMLIIFESVPMLFIKNYQNESTLVETTACQSWHIFFETECTMQTLRLCERQS